MIESIEGIIVMVSDQQEALQFYTKKLGFEKKTDNDVAEYRWITVGPKNSNTVISLVNPTFVKEWPHEIIQQAKSRIGTTTGIWFYTKDIDTTYKELKSKQVDITPPKKQVWGGVMSSVYDQDRNILGLVGDSKE